jgi:hypothetical protein
LACIAASRCGLAPDSEHVSQKAHLCQVSDTRLTVLLPRLGVAGAGLAVGRWVTAEAGDARGAYLARFKGTVTAVESRPADIRLDGAAALAQRRAGPRAPAVLVQHRRAAR